MKKISIKRRHRPEVNLRLRAAIVEVVETQMRENNPVETRQTFQRLIEEGHSEEEAKRLIGCVVVSELNDVLHTKTPYNHERFVKALNQLPTLPWEEKATT